jgi:hypothetical protein
VTADAERRAPLPARRRRRRTDDPAAGSGDGSPAGRARGSGDGAAGAPGGRAGAPSGAAASAPGGGRAGATGTPRGDAAGATGAPRGDAASAPGGGSPDRHDAGPAVEPLPDGAHEWISFEDPDEDRTWLFDITFLESTWTCIFGRGCQGVLTQPTASAQQGCCSYGAHCTGTEDKDRVTEAARRLTPDLWQRRPRRSNPADHVFRQTRDGQWMTRLAAGACIFLNGPDFPGGSGCALHLLAQREGVAPHTVKPDVCWQLPLRREDLRGDDGHVVSVVRQWERRDWGAGGAEFAWWCTEAPEAFVGALPVHQALREELRALVGPTVHALLDAALSHRQPGRGGEGDPRRTRSLTRRGTTPATRAARAGRMVVPLPHPARRAAT